MTHYETYNYALYSNDSNSEWTRDLKKICFLFSLKEALAWWRIQLLGLIEIYNT